ncbi:MAG TPA: hypothetical protein ENN87_15525 [Phycisphaerales bacterium]|nr:hypothetical protein [Phycisphaerales bacterium]
MQSTTSCSCLLAVAVVLVLAGPGQSAAANLLQNGDVEQWQEGRPVQWSTLWTRQAGAGTLGRDEQIRRDGASSVRIEHRGGQDWSLQYAQRLAVQPGDWFEYTAEVFRKADAAGGVTLCVTAYDVQGRAVDWSLGGRNARQAGQWESIRSSFIVPDGVTHIQPRLIGYGPGTVWFDGASLVSKGRIEPLPPDQVEGLALSNALLSVRVDATGALHVTDRRSGRRWTQSSSDGQGRLIAARRRGEAILLTWMHVATAQPYEATIHLEPQAAEVVVTITPDGPQPRQCPMSRDIAWPGPFESATGDSLVVPMNEGISYPVDGPVDPPGTLIAYGGHGICMAFWGVTDGRAGYMAILETPDDAAIRIDRRDGRLCIGPVWHDQKGLFGYPRTLRYVFFDDGGHVAMCKRYRRYVQNRGALKTLADKRRENPNVDLLIGAVNVWCWERDPVGLVRDMQAAGIERILWSRRCAPQEIAELNRMPGVLTSRYDIYQDLMDPQIVAEKLGGVHSDWTQAGWPDDLMRDANGDWRKGWQVRGRDGQMYPCGVLCDRRALDHARQRVPEELKTHPYRCRFIDTTTASPWRECYDPRHPMTRSDSRHWKMELLRYMSEEMKLVTGSETGHDAAVPYVHYFEGMLSLGPYRVPDAGRDMARIWTEVPERVATFQLGHRYRLPLWELVYHDCVVAQWYWGDYNNKLPSLWDKRDLFNVLYATPPMFMFTRGFWNENRERFVQSYRAIGPVVRAVGYAEMTDHVFLTPDRDVQQTVFADGTRITVNFGDAPYRVADGTTIVPNSYHYAPGGDGADDR